MSETDSPLTSVALTKSESHPKAFSIKDIWTLKKDSGVELRFFLSTFYVLNKYEENNEILIFWTFGINKLEFINIFNCVI